MDFNREINKLHLTRKFKSKRLYHILGILMDMSDVVELSDSQLIRLLKTVNYVLINNNKYFDYLYKKISKKSKYYKMKNVDKYFDIIDNSINETGIITDFIVFIDSDKIIDNYMIYELFTSCKNKLNYSTDKLRSFYKLFKI